MLGDVNFTLAMSEDELEETLSYSIYEDNESERSETKDDVDPLMYCVPMYFAFNRGMYELMDKGLL